MSARLSLKPVQILLTPLVPLYATALAAKNLAYDRALITPKRLQWPVVSIGNLSVGGAGKTPVVICLARLLQTAGHSVDVLSRGYGRSSDEVTRVDPDGPASRFGDEPLLIARTTGVPVYVGADRHAAGLLAERSQPMPGIHLLDDGFQHRRLARDVDIVVLHASDFDQHLLPAGRLREPLSALHRAGILILRAEDRHLEAELRRRSITAPIWIQHRRLAMEPTARAVAFCAIARPDEFFAALTDQELAATSAFRDHHTWSDTDLDALLQLRARHRAESFITTEKDFVRLTPPQRARLAPLHVARLEVVFENEVVIMAQFASLLVRK
ncbi:MAG: tetraacyldisaccharide 4'-kinase [Silvibacterium sp.]|nr:tetraacyldisaccharide 4'-kinase [Silvibacterium sp.]MBV8631535.1 tetraacyldisaccharide 4'-kinase [Silvibacterium sp.]